jgi:hypothetical protein
MQRTPGFAGGETFRDGRREPRRQADDVAQPRKRLAFCSALEIVRQLGIGDAIDAHQRLDGANVEVFPRLLHQLGDAAVHILARGKTRRVGWMGRVTSSFERIKQRLP